MEYRKRLIVGTAGHIDHGKSSLVRMLTGVDPDRLLEEKKRGITIDLGFAYLEIGDYSFSFVDVPGHEDYVKNMAAGAIGFDACIMAVDINEGVKEQTIEHTNIVHFLGINY
ncbi:MAG: 50S ribosome-binding GTPase, partial [Calditerrivibrio sp.]|nr:50S ribosome-binding GTPase [Calditerrivibrio sp.]